MKGIVRSEHRIRDDLTVEFVFDGPRKRIDIYWSPRVPTKLSETELSAYRAARSAFVAKVSETVGGAVAVIEL